MDDLVKRLRLGSQTTVGAYRMGVEAADRIEADAKRIAKLERDKFAMRGERDTAKIAAANYADFNRTWRTRAEAAEARVKVLEDALEWAYRGDGLDECALHIQRLSSPFREPDGPDHAVQVGVRAVIDMIRERAALEGEKK